MEKTTSNGKRFACSLPPSTPQPHPLLMISHGKHRQRQTFFSKSENRHYVKTIPELRGQFIWASHNEWLVLTDFKMTECSLLNLVSMERIQLPPMQSKHHTLCVLTSSPDRFDCQIIFFNVYRKNGSTLLMCKPGDDRFYEQEVDEVVLSMPKNVDDVGVRGFWHSVVAFNGNVYLLTSSSDLFVVDFSHPGPQAVEIKHQDRRDDGLPQNIPPNIIDYSGYLVESNGELLFITMLRHGRNIREVYGFTVHRFDFANKTWIDVKSIDKTRAIFLDEHSAMSCSATEESQLNGNSIYYVKSGDRCLYVFDLEKKATSPSLPCPDVSRPYSEGLHSGRRRRHSEFHWIQF